MESTDNQPTQESEHAPAVASSETQIQSKMPSGVKLIKELGFNNACTTVCHYKGFTYVGQVGGAIDRIDQQGNVHKAYIQVTGDVVSLAAHADKLYCLCHVDRRSPKINVHDITDGSFLTSWDHPRFLFYGQRITVVNDNQLAVGDYPGRQIIIYSFTGDIIRSVPCPESLDMTKSMCMSSCGDDCVVISEKATGIIVKMSLIDGTVLWSTESVTRPGGMTSHLTEYILVAGGSIDETKLFLLRERNGELLAEFTDPDRDKAANLDLCLYDTTLIVPRHDDNTVLMYEILT